jgi:VWFA-related protein
MSRALVIGFALVLAVSVHGRPQSAAFRAETRLVVLRATVTNARRELVGNLDQQAFTIYENGTRQPIALFRRDDVPVSVGLLIDNSGSMRTLRPKVEAAALAFARASNPDDEFFVLNFADKSHLDVPFTSDLRVLEAGIVRVDAIGGTAMRDAVDAAGTYTQAYAARDRKALVIITDGNDNASVTSLDRIVTEVGRQELTIYAIGLLHGADSATAKHARRELDHLTGATGGVAYYPATTDDIEAVALGLAQQIRRQYTIAYTPVNQALDGSYRTIRLVVNSHEPLTVRTRAGYVATSIAR